VILNRDLRGDDVPAFRVVELDLPDPETWEVARAWAWASLSRFALTFDPERFRRETGEALDPGAALRDAGRRAPSALRELHLTVLRAALWEIYSKHQGPVTDHKEAGQIDTILDAIYADVTGGQPRPVGDPGPLEPGLGPFGAIGPVNRRFSFQARKVSTREELYDRVDGLLLREIDESTIVSGLYLYPRGTRSRTRARRRMSSFCGSCRAAEAPPTRPSSKLNASGSADSSWRRRESRRTNRYHPGEHQASHQRFGRSKPIPQGSRKPLGNGARPTDSNL
jgi:hypothetical protein